MCSALFWLLMRRPEGADLQCDTWFWRKWFSDFLGMSLYLNDAYGNWGKELTEGPEKVKALTGTVSNNRHEASKSLMEQFGFLLFCCWDGQGKQHRKASQNLTHSYRMKASIWEQDAVLVEIRFTSTGILGRWLCTETFQLQILWLCTILYETSSVLWKEKLT